MTTVAHKQRQLHVKVDERGLEGLLEDVAREMAAAVRDDGYARIPLPAVKRALRQSLSSRIVAFDLCGLSSVCWETEEFDPWTEN